MTAYLAAAPGGLSQVMGLAAELDADIRAIAIVQTMRVVIIAVGLPAGSVAARAGQPRRAQRRRRRSIRRSSANSLLLIAASTVVALIAYRIRFPGGLLFGAMLASAALHGSGIDSRGDAVVGDQHRDDRVRRGHRLALRRHAAASAGAFLGAAFGSFAVAVAVTARVRGRAGRNFVAAGRRGDDRLRARRGRRHDAARARAPSRPGLCRRASLDAHLLRLAGDAADGAPRRAQAQHDASRRSSRHSRNRFIYSAAIARLRVGSSSRSHTSTSASASASISASS